MTSAPVVIVGAGVGGLHLAAALVSRGIDPIVLEAERRPGGVIRSEARDGRILELGPQRARLTPVMRRLVDTLGLGAALLTAPTDLPLFILRRGQLRRAPLSLRDLAGTDLLRLPARLRLLLEPFTTAFRDDETVATALRRRFGASAYRDLLGPLFGGLYASDPDDMFVRHALRPLLRDSGIGRSAVIALLKRELRRAPTAPPCTFRDGLSTLTDAMAERVRQNLRLGARVHAVRRDGQSMVVESTAGEVRCQRVVLTVPAAIAAVMLAALAPDVADRLRRLRYNRIALVHLQSEARLTGLGFQTAFDEPLETRGVTFNGAMFGSSRDNLFTSFLGGARNPSLPDRDDEEIADIAARELEAVTDAKATPIGVARTAIPAWDRSWSALDDLHLPGRIHLCANYESRAGIAGRLGRAESLAQEMTSGGAA